MNLSASIINYKRYLKRKNFSTQSIKSYLSRLKHFLIWLPVPVETVTQVHVKMYIDLLLEKHLAAKTINERLVAIRSFYRYLDSEEDREIPNPVKSGMALRLPKPLPRHLRESEVDIFLAAISKKRDRALFMLMLRCGLRVSEAAGLELSAIDYQRNQIIVRSGKGGKDRMTYISNDAADALATYLQVRPVTEESKVFLVEKGNYKGKQLSVRGVQKRMEYYSRKSGVSISSHQLRHTMATQLLNAGSDPVTIQEVLGHSRIETTMRYSKISNMRVQKDYYKAMEKVMQNGKTRL
ncbi:MAG: tyrosine-type recombinase/integrase [Desulfobulbaceae bacterium]|nr:tyrosine-type recombinase/integrase [Desulfobulbaceae bacterium]